MRVFRITFHNQGKIYEIYAARVNQSDLYGFIEVGALRFEETDLQVVSILGIGLNRC
jgi:hypothetical protein